MSNVISHSRSRDCGNRVPARYNTDDITPMMRQCLGQSFTSSVEGLDFKESDRTVPEDSLGSADLLKKSLCCSWSDIQSKASLRDVNITYRRILFVFISSQMICRQEY